MAGAVYFPEIVNLFNVFLKVQQQFPLSVPPLKMSNIKKMLLSKVAI